MPLRGRGRNQGKGDGESRPVARLAFHFHEPVVVLNEPINHGETQPRAVARLLGGEERLEDPGQEFPGAIPAPVSWTEILTYLPRSATRGKPAAV